MRSYETTNSDYGWKPESKTNILEIMKSDDEEKKELEEEEQRLLREAIYRTSNSEYGQGSDNVRRNKISDGLAVLAKATKMKPFQVARMLKEDTGVKNIDENCAQNSGYAPNLKNYKVNRKKQNLLMTTTGNDYGTPPNPIIDGPDKVFPLSNKFSKTFTTPFEASKLNKA